MLNLDRFQQAKGYLFSLLVFSIFASLMMGWIISDYSAGVTPDSVIYLDTAESILAGNGIVAMGEPMTHYPPGYPILLTLAAFIFSGNFPQVVILFHSILFGLNLFLVGLTVLFFHNEKNPSWMMGIVVLGFAIATPNFKLHSMVWSDSPFITLVLLVFLMLTVYILRPNRYLLVSFSLLAGFATLIRYIGITLLPPIVLALFLFQAKPLGQRLKDIFASGTIALIPIVALFTRNIVISQTLANRESSFQFLGFHLDIFVLLSRLYDFVFPILMPMWLKVLQFVLATVFLLFGTVYLYRKNYISNNFNSTKIILPTIHAVFFVTYIAFLVFSQLFLEVRQNWDYRILLPPFLSLLLFASALVWALPEVADERLARLGFVFIALTSIGINSVITLPTISSIQSYGQGYNSVDWYDSETISVFSSMFVTNDMKVYSNGPDVIWYWTKKPSVMMPRRLLSGTRQPNIEFKQELRGLCLELEQGRTLLVYLEGVYRSYLPDPQEIEETCEISLPVLYVLEDGFIYGRQTQ